MNYKKLFSEVGDTLPMHKNSLLLKKACLSLVALFTLAAATSGCGGASGPFAMDTEATMFVGNSDGTSPFAFIVNPEEQSSNGDLMAAIVTEFPDRFLLDLTSLSLAFNFANVGTINVSLDPNNPSSATIFKVTTNGNPEGTHTMNLNLVIQTPDQNLVLSGVSLSSETALLQLDEDLPTLGFFFQDVAMELDLAGLTVVIPAELITPDTSNQ